MVDTPRTDSYLTGSDFQDGQPPGSISPQDERDLIVSKVNIARPRNTQTGNYTLTLADAGGEVEINSGSAATVTVPPNASVAFEVGLEIPVCGIGTGVVSIAAGAGVTIITPSTQTLAAQYSRVRLTQRATNVWMLSGGLLPLPVVRAQRIADFLNSLGVATHMYQSQYLDAGTGWVTILPLLKSLGVSAVRDGPWDNAATLEHSYAFLAANGIKLLLSAYPIAADTPSLVVANQVSQITGVLGQATDAVIGVEQPNEPVNQSYTYNGVASQTGVNATGTYPGLLPVAQFMSAFYAALKANALTSKIPVIHSTLCGDSDSLDDGLQWPSIPAGYTHKTLTTNAQTLTSSAVLHFASVPTTGAGAIFKGLQVYAVGLTNIAPGVVVSSVTSTTVTLSANVSITVPSGTVIRFGATMPDATIFSDVVNIHTYPMYGSAVATSAASVDPAGGLDGNQFNQSLRDGYVSPFGNGEMIGPTMAQVKTFPVWCTEHGYPTVGATANGSAVNQAVQGKQLLNSWLNAWQMGIERFFIYNLIDDQASPDAFTSFGLYNFNLTPKSSATWISNFTTILSDVSAYRKSFEAGSIGLTVSGLPNAAGSPLATGQYMLFQRADGVYFLIIWPQVNNWNVAAGTQITSFTSVTATVKFAYSGTITTYDPTVGTSAQATVAGASTTVGITDYPMILSFQ